MNNTIRVVAQSASYTIRSMTILWLPKHNLCMSKVHKGTRTDPLAQMSGQRIRECRERRQWTQEDLARETGWSPEKPSRAQKNALAQSRIANYEQGTRRVGFEEAEIFGRIFGLPAPYFMGVISLREAEVLATLRRTEPAAQQEAIPFTKTPTPKRQPQRHPTTQHPPK